MVCDLLECEVGSWWGGGDVGGNRCVLDDCKMRESYEMCLNSQSDVYKRKGIFGAERIGCMLK